MMSRAIEIGHSKPIHSEISLPSNKSDQLRSLLFAMMAHGQSSIKHISKTQDLITFLCILSNFKVKYFQQGDSIQINGLGGILPDPKSNIDVKNSGILLRFLTPLMGLSSKPSYITGDESIQNLRTLSDQISALKTLGCSVQCLNKIDHAPLIISGPMIHNQTEIHSKDSQFLSGLIFASLFRKQSTTIHLLSIGERPYIELTLSWLDKFNIPYTFSPKKITITPKRIEAFNHTITKDLSSALFMIVHALIHSSSLSLKDLSTNTKHPEKHALQVLKNMGVHFKDIQNDLYIPPNQEIHGVEANLNDCIDALPALTILATQAKSPSKFTGISNAQHKESNRPRALVTELSKMGAKIIYQNDTLSVFPSKLHSSTLSSHNDHRIAMSLYLAASICHEKSKLIGTEWISKSYPNFLKDIQNMGGFWCPLS